MIPELFPIPGPWRGHLSISARPRGGDWLEEVRGWRSAGIDTVVSLLEPEEESELGLDAHCRQGIGRSALIAAGLLVTAGIEPNSAIRTVAAAMRLSVPDTPEQRRWSEELANHLVITG